MMPPDSGAGPEDGVPEPPRVPPPPVAALLQRESADLDVMSHPFGGVKVNVPDPPDAPDPPEG